MRGSRRTKHLLERLLWALMLVVFSAHHAAPGAPIWTGGSGSAHGHHASASKEPRFVAVHDHDALHHCELCHSSAFQVPSEVAGVPRALLRALQSNAITAALSTSSDLRLPQPHAPPLL
jgi:hypothetical protein